MPVIAHSLQPYNEDDRFAELPIPLLHYLALGYAGTTFMLRIKTENKKSSARNVMLRKADFRKHEFYTAFDLGARPLLCPSTYGPDDGQWAELTIQMTKAKIKT
ncbi:unnamed protein product [Clavelina lepadiformis]|uniref:Uncharacterized protein n=1 Tax=Clavelina lepadiformis TaxID=159417 RepID=A0ABP0GW64_CLALP